MFLLAKPEATVGLLLIVIVFIDCYYCCGASAKQQYNQIEVLPKAKMF